MSNDVPVVSAYASWFSKASARVSHVSTPVLVCSYVSALLIVYWTSQYLVKWQERRQIRALYKRWIVQARQERNSKQHKVLEEVLREEDDKDASLRTAVETADLIRQGQLDPRQNVIQLACRCRKFGRGHVNAITEEFYDEAAEAAQQLKLDGNNKNILSPLYGVPVSVKESFRLQGSYSTGGLACRLKARDTFDGLIVQVLKEAGALPLASGNVTQIMMLPESVNYIWGRSRNPWNLTRTPGGSSGGDAALVAMECVPLALCSDVAGSIRIPSSFCGVVGFKPTSTRLSLKGNMRPRKDDKQGTGMVIPPAIGPIARTVEDCAAFMQATLVPAMFEGDFNVPRIPFDHAAYTNTKKLTIGYFSDDGWFEPCATSKRAVQETVDKLTQAGHTCVPFEPPTDGWYSYALLVAINAAEGNFKSYVEALESEQAIPEYNLLIFASGLPDWLKQIVLCLVDKRRGHLLKQGRSGGIPVFDLWKKVADIIHFREQWSDAMHGYHAVIYPSVPLPAFPHGISAHLTASLSYMFIANLLNWPCGAVPVATVQPHETKYSSQYHDKITRLVANKVMPGSEGLPISVSVMTPAYQDETCLRVMKEVEKVVEFSAKPEMYKNHAYEQS